VGKIRLDRRFLDSLLVDHSRALGGPLLFGHRSITDDVLAEDVLDILHVTPALWITVLQPNKRRTNIRWAMLDVMHDDGLFAPSWHENFHSVIVIAVGALIERALNASKKTLAE
jgi:hypothetical protein